MGGDPTDAVVEGDFLQAPSLDRTPDGELVVCAPNGLRYRCSVCVFIMNNRGFFLGCQRCDDRRVLQCVQGGMLANETPQQTAEREVFEEIGLPASMLRFAAEVEPLATEGDVRAAFRYNSKTWRKLRIKGQELYPLLYLADMDILRLLNFKAVPGVRQEFCGARWVTLEELMRRSSPSKAAVMANMCMAVAPLACRLLDVEGTFPVSDERAIAESTGTAEVSKVEPGPTLGGGC